MASSSKNKALAELLQSRFVYDKTQQRLNATRQARLAQFLREHQHASQWALCVAAVQDALSSGVKPSDASLCDAIERCGKARQLGHAAHLYRSVYRQIGAPRSLAAHVAFMGACASCGDYTAAREQFLRHLARDREMRARNPAHRPVVTDDLTTEYLRAALASSIGLSSDEPRSPLGAAAASSPGAGADVGVDVGSSGDGNSGAARVQPWQQALEDLVAIRKDRDFLRVYNDLTPLMLEVSTALAEVGGQWALCLELIQSASRDQLVVPPEAFDTAIRACYRAGRHVEVVEMMERLIATRTPPDERSVRLAMVSAEEVGVLERQAGAAAPQGWALALQLFQAMELNGVPLYQQSFEIPLRSCAAVGKWEEALRMLDTMRKHRRPISGYLYSVALASRIEACQSVAEIQRLMRLPVSNDGTPNVHLYLAAMRCCLRLKEWGYLEKLNREMKAREMPESYEKMQLLIEVAYAQGKYHAVLMRFARFDNITSFEKERVKKHQTTRMYENDFELPVPVLDMVLDSYDRLSKDGPTDDRVNAAYVAATRRKQRERPQLPFSHNKQSSSTEPWMFSGSERAEKSPPTFY